MGAVDRDRDRVTSLRLQEKLNRYSHGAYFADLPFAKGVEFTAICDAIYLAQHDGTPFTILGLSEHLGITRPTLGRRLDALAARGVIIRQIKQRVGRRIDVIITIDPAIFTPPERAANVDRKRAAILAAAKEFAANDQAAAAERKVVLSDQPHEHC